LVTTQPINPWLAAFFLVEIDKTVTFLVDFSGFYTKQNATDQVNQA
jgi:hypothetical protein